MQESRSDEDSYPSLDRRVSARYEFSTDIEIEWRSMRVWGQVRNISRSGMFIELSVLPELNARFPANLALNKPLRIECVVRRVVPRYGIGVSITIAEEEDRTRYEALLVALSQGSGPAGASVELPVGDNPQKPLVACPR